METDLFTYNDETGEVEYSPADVEEVVEDGVEDSNSVDILGTEVSDPEDQSEVVSEDPADVADLLSSGGAVLLSADEVSALSLASPASGSLSSNTLDYFDRLVSGLPSDYTYVAYRNSSDDSYAGTIVFGDQCEVSGNSLIFGEGATEIDVSRSNGSSYNNYITYTTADATDAIITVVSTGTILYYTNALEGYPVLGGYREPAPASALLVVGLLAAFASAVLMRLLNRR